VCPIFGETEKESTLAPQGYAGRILHVDLTNRRWDVESPEARFYRTYLGGSAMGTYYLLKHTPPHTDPLESENTLSLMTGVVTGAPFSGQSRVTATAKSPVSGLIGDSQSGGLWPAELKAAGFDGIVFHGRADAPCWLWIHDSKVELRDAEDLWGRVTGDVEDAIRSELDDKRIQVLQCGPAAEKGVLYGALMSSTSRANGRTGMGTIMASKNLKAIAVRGTGPFAPVDPEAVKALSKWGAEHFQESDVAGMRKLGTAGSLLPLNEEGGLPTRNWSSGVFEGAEAISGERMAETVLKRRDACYGCVVRCKRIVEIEQGPYIVDPRYGGPEYETLAAMGSYCGVSNLAAICRANQLCNMYGMDTISCGATIAWAMDCFECGLITEEETNGVPLRFGDANALVQTVEKIGRREGFGRLLGEGSVRAAERLGVGQDLVVATKRQEYPAHMPQQKRSLALIYSVNPFGADHQSHEHDPFYCAQYADRMSQLDLIGELPQDVLNAEKVRYAFYTQLFYSATDSACVCQFVFGPSFQLYGPSQLVDAVRAVTGWNFSLWELMKVGERRLNLMRAFNVREGVGAEEDTAPVKLGVPLRGGPTNGAFVSDDELDEARALYYAMAGWDKRGRPRRAKLAELGLNWVGEALTGIE
jgi:aldehyde:ferredoxin oxidoreductase